jgi:FkbM family methyltransferase
MKNYIQIGTNNGDDEFKKIMEKLKEKSNIFLIEPNPNLIQSITEQYKDLNKFHNVNILNVGIVSDKSINTLNLYRSGDGHSSILKRKSHNCIFDTINFIPKTLKDILTEYNINEIELLYIDTEGYDYTILNSIPLEELIIKEIICEIWPYDIDSSEDIKTGPCFFEQVIKPKMFNYDIGTIMLDNIINHKFVKKI